jgi:aminoglycoside 6'-N-acetyltransferase I
VTIRPIEARDAAAWARMRARLWPRAERDELVRETGAFAAGEGETMLAAVFLAEDDRATPLGFIEIAVRAFSDGCESMPVPHVEGWFVEAFARGRGIGRGLMSAGEVWATAQGFNELASDTEVHNASSQRAHEACGFEEVDRLVKFRKKLA